MNKEFKYKAQQTFGVFLLGLMWLLIFKLVVISLKVENAEGLRGWSSESAARVRPAKQQTGHQPNDVCCMVAALHFLMAL